MPIFIKRTSIALLLMFGAAIVMSSTMQAQPKRISVEEQINILKKRLKLNNKQINKITCILEDQREEMTTAMNENRSDPDTRHAVIQELLEKTNTQIKGVLTEEQAEKYDELIEERLEKMKKRMQERDEQ